MKSTLSERTFDVFNICLMILVCCTIIFPFIQQIVISFSPPGESDAISLHLFTRNPTLDAYKRVLIKGSMLKAYYWTALRTVLGTFLSVMVSTMLAYPLSKKYLVGKKFWGGMIVFTMFFGGGLIPTYLLVRSLQLTNTIWALVIPSTCSAYTIVIIRNFFTSIPDEIEESASMDGANDIVIFFIIIIPLSAPILATVTLWSMVGHWNSWFDAMIYITTSKIKVLQILLREIMAEAQPSVMNNYGIDMQGQQYTGESVKSAVLMAATLPILMVYPFLQKYFVKGIMIGAVKG